MEHREHDPEEPPELAFAEPGDTSSLRRRPMQRFARFVGIVAIVALVLPGIVIGISTATRTAELACRVVASTAAPQAAGAEARFEWSGHEGPGWYCYAIAFNGSETQLRFLGFIPEIRVVPGTPTAPGTDV